MSCSQDFKKIFSVQANAGEGGLFSIFSDPLVVPTADQIEKAVEIIADDAIEESKNSKDSIISYNFNTATKQLEKIALSEKSPMPHLSEEVRGDIIQAIKVKLNKANNYLNSNPLVGKVGEEVPMFDFTNISKLTHGIETMERYIAQQMEFGLLKIIFINDLGQSRTADERYEPFVVTDNSLNKNINIYKNELWNYIVETSGIKTKTLHGTKLYVDGKLNEDLFLPQSNGKSLYVQVLESIRDRMETGFNKTNVENYIKVNNTDELSIAQAYLKMLILANFDTFMLKNHSARLVLNQDGINTFAIPSNDESKYKLVFRWSKQLNIDNSEHSGIEKNTTSLIKMLSDVIPYYEKTNVNGEIVWGESEGFTLGSSNLDSIGAILNDMPDELLIPITENINGKAVVSDISIGRAYKRYDEGDLSFQAILAGIISAIEQGKDDTQGSLNSREKVLRSINMFLYGPSGVNKSFANWKLENADIADFVANPEVAIINHIRNTVKFKYRMETISLNGKTLDVLNVNSKISKDFAELIQNLSKAWDIKQVVPADLAGISSYESFFRFLTNPKQGGMIISNAAKQEFLDKYPNINFTSQKFKDAFLKLLSKEAHGMVASFTYNEQMEQDEDLISPEAEEIINTLRNPTVNDELHLIELFKGMHYSEKYNVLTQTKDSMGNSLPTMGIANLASLYNIAIANESGDSFFKENSGLFTGVEIVKEVIGKNNSMNVEELYHNELFKLSFVRHFLMSGVNEEKFLVQPFNFSDKPKIFAIGLNSKTHLKSNRGVYKETLAEMTSADLKTEFFDHQKKYYNNLLDSVYSDLSILEPESFKSGVSIEGKMKDIEAFLSGRTKRQLLAKVQAVFNKGEYVEIVEDVHYSMYGKGSSLLHFNQLLKSNIQLFNNRKLFDKYAAQQEQKVTDYTSNEVNIDLEDIVLKNGYVSNEASKRLLLTNYFKMSEEDLFNIVEVEGNKKYTLKLKTADGKISEILSKYLWTKNLAISQYVNLTVKDSYQHPAKLGKFTSIDLSTEEGWKQYTIEEDKRSVVFTKRMNIPGASMTIYGRGRNGISTSIRVAATEEPNSEVFNTTGELHVQDTMDGGGRSNPFFNEQTIGSLPGVDLKKTQKPIGESINSKFSTMLKFATFSMNNEEIRNSMSSKKPLYTLMKKMNSVDLYDGNYQDILITPDQNGADDFFEIAKVFSNFYIQLNGKPYKFRDLEWIPGGPEYDLSYEIEDAEGNVTIGHKTVAINTLFDLWEALGGAYSGKMVDGKIVLSEESIDIVGSIIKKHSSSGSNLKLKDKMIALFLPVSAVKKGVANINLEGNIYDDKSKMAYFNFDTSFFGVQLDAYHSTEDSETNEITQVMSAIAQNASTPELYNKVYDSISSIVKKNLGKFQIAVAGPKGVEKIINEFIAKLNDSSSQINNSRAIINGITDATSSVIPLGNKTIYKQFISSVISNINTEFIRRSFPGTASVMNPSQGVIQIFEDNKGKKYLTHDLITKATASLSAEELLEIQDDTKLSEYNKTEAIINKYLLKATEFAKQTITLGELEPLDYVSLSEPITIGEKTFEVDEVIPLVAINVYFKVKEALKANPNIVISRNFNASRDLRPVRVTFDVNGEKSNSWNQDSVNFAWWLEFNKAELLANDLVSSDPMFKDFAEYIEEINPDYKDADNKGKFKALQEYTKRWVDKSNALLAAQKTLKSYSEITEPGNKFKTLFAYTENGAPYIERFTTRYSPNNIYVNEVPIKNYVHRNMENIHSNVHKTNFQIADESLANITPELFLKNLQKFSEVKPAHGTPYNLILSNPNTKESINIVVEDKSGRDYYEKDNKLFDGKVEVGTKMYINVVDGYRLSSYGQKMYKMPGKYDPEVDSEPPYSVFKDANGQEVLLIKENNTIDNPTATKTKPNLAGFVSSLNQYNIVKFNDYHRKFQNLVTSNDEDDSLLELMNIVSKATFNKPLRKYINIKINSYKGFKEKTQALPVRLKTKDLGDAFSEYSKTESLKLFSTYVHNLSKTIYASWLFSNQALCARIPAQALQSFMSMDTVGYVTGEANDVYVSHWQLWLQGSDFDIDKLYMMMYGFESGVFMGWSPHFDMLNQAESFKLPLPDNNHAPYLYIDPAKQGEILDESTVFDLDKFIPAGASNLGKLVAGLNALNALSPEKKAKILSIRGTDKILVEKINTHNKFYSEGGFKNFIVHNLLETSRHPKNQVASYSPITFGVYEDIKEKLGTSQYLGLYDGYSMFKQQEQNSIGKKVIGIAATGLKNYFGLIKYYSEYYNSATQVTTKDNTYFLRDFTLNGKKFKVDKISGLNLTRTGSNLLITHLRGTLGEETYLKTDGTPYTDAEKEELIAKIVALKPDIDVALNISSILSLATDNAKELMLAKINAGIEFAGMHIYLAMMGVDAETVASYMTSPNALQIKQALGRDFFNKDINSSTAKQLKKMIDKPGVDQDFLKEFIKIYTYANETIDLGGLFKVNQGSKANQEDLYGLSMKFQKIINSREEAYFEGTEWSEDLNNVEAQVATVIKEKPYLVRDSAYVTKVLTEARRLGFTQGGKIDSWLYFNNEEYRKALVDFYNVMKGTFNIFDALNHLPHFYEMYKSFIVGDNFINDNVNKYKLAKEILTEVVDSGSKNNEINTYAINSASRVQGNRALQIQWNTDTLNKINDYHDTVVISQFFKGLEFSIDLRAFAEYVGEGENISMLDNDKSAIKTSDYRLDELPKNELSFNNEHDLAQFRYLMETYLIPHIKSKFKSNGFLSNYTYGTHKNYNLKQMISYYLDKSNFSELENLEIGMSKIVNPNNEEFNIPIKNEKGELGNFRLADLLFLYDLMINEGRFGGNRATMFLYKDIDDKNALSRKFIEHQKSLENDPQFIQSLKDNLLESKNERLFMYLKLFGTTNAEIQSVRLTDDVTMVFHNRYFGFPTSMENYIQQNKTSHIAENIIDKIKNNGLTIETDCK